MALTKPQVEMFPAGTVLQVVNQLDAGSSTTSATRVNLNGSLVNITPKSSSSKLILNVSFLGTITAGGSGVNSYGSFDISEGSTKRSDTYLMGVVSGAGTNMQTQGICSLSYYLSNTALTTRTFSLYGFKTGGTSTCTAASMVWTITEVAV